MIQELEERRDLSLLIRVALPIMEIGLEGLGMVRESKPGKTELAIPENGQWVKLMVKENSFTWTETCTREIGVMTGQMATECTSIRMELVMKETGEMISSTAKESKRGMTAADTQGTTWMARSTVLGTTNGPMGPKDSEEHGLYFKFNLI